MIQTLPLLPTVPLADKPVRTAVDQDDAPSAFTAQPAKGSVMPAVGTLLPQIRITKRRLKQLEAIALIHELRDNGRRELAYKAMPFVLCGVPIHRAPALHL